MLLIYAAALQIPVCPVAVEMRKPTDAEPDEQITDSFDPWLPW
jgi:hypothetical protein